MVTVVRRKGQMSKKRRIYHMKARKEGSLNVFNSPTRVRPTRYSAGTRRKSLDFVSGMGRGERMWDAATADGTKGLQYEK